MSESEPWLPFDSDDAGSRGPTDWRRLGAQETAATWGRLRAWTDWFRCRYCLDHRVVPACWYEHPAIVDLLSALMDYHGYCYDRLQSPSTPADWHRVFRDLEPRLREWVSRTGCTGEMHRPDQFTPAAIDEAAWARHVAHDIAARKNQIGSGV